MAEVTYLQCTILVSCNLVIPVTVAIQRGEHNAEGPCPLAKQDEKMVPQALLGEEKSPVVNWGGKRSSASTRLKNIANTVYVTIIREFYILEKGVISFPNSSFL